MISRWRIHKDASLEQRAVKVGHERAHVARRVFFLSQLIEILAIFRREVIAIGFIDRIVFSLGRHFDVLVAQDIGPDRRIECETVSPAAGRVNQNCRGSVHHISGGDLLIARLQQVLQRVASSFERCLGTAQNRENRAY